MSGCGLRRGDFASLSRGSALCFLFRRLHCPPLPLTRSTTRVRRDRRALATLLIAFVAAAPYLPSLGYGFVYDDGPIIADNPALHAPSGMLAAWRSAYWPAEWGRAGLFRPVVQFMYALLWNVSGGSARIFHSYSVVLYALCAVAVLWMLARAMPMRAAVIGALLFAAHPLHVESVANVAGSSEISGGAREPCMRDGEPAGIRQAGRCCRMERRNWECGAVCHCGWCEGVRSDGAGAGRALRVGMACAR